MFTFCKHVLIFFRRKSEPSKLFSVLVVNAEKRASASRSSSYLPKRAVNLPAVNYACQINELVLQHAVIAFTFKCIFSKYLSAVAKVQYFRRSTVCVKFSTRAI